MSKLQPLLRNKQPYVDNFGRAKRTINTNKNLRKILNFDFLSIVEKRDTGYFLIGKNELLVSPSMLNYQLSRKVLAKIPMHILEQRRAIGSNLMENIKTVFENKIYDTTTLEMSEIDRKYLNNLLDWLVENQIKVLAVEKFITNGEICGIVDMIVMWNKCICALEIKTRNKKDIRFTDITQATIYYQMLRCPTYVVMIDDLGQVETVRISATKRYEYYNEYCSFIKFWKKFGVLENEKVQPIQVE